MEKKENYQKISFSLTKKLARQRNIVRGLFSVRIFVNKNGKFRKKMRFF
jgi:hypothetical protein